MVEVFGVIHGRPFSEVVARTELLSTIMKYQDAEEGPFPRPYFGEIPVIQPDLVIQPQEFEEVPF
jgi:hypothetical protein